MKATLGWQLEWLYNTKRLSWGRISPSCFAWTWLLSMGFCTWKYGPLWRYFCSDMFLHSPLHRFHLHTEENYRSGTFSPSKFPAQPRAHLLQCRQYFHIHSSWQTWHTSISSLCMLFCPATRHLQPRCPDLLRCIFDFPPSSHRSSPSSSSLPSTVH